MNEAPPSRQRTGRRAAGAPSFCVLFVVLSALASTAIAGPQQTEVPQEPGPLAALEKMSRTMLEIGGATKQSIEAPTGKLVYWTVGSGPTVVLLHGTNDQAGLWGRAIFPLRDRYHFVIPDFPGHGESEPKDGPLDLGMMLEAAEALIDITSPEEPVAIVGNSMGGWIALLYALDHPDRVSRLVLEDSGGLSLEVSDLTLVPKSRDEARAVFDAAFGEGKSFPDAILDDFIRRAPASPAARLDQTDWTRYLLDERLGDLAIPTTLIWGEDDGILPLDYAKRMQSMLPDAELITVPHCGHIPHNECAEAFTKLLEQALRRE